MNVKTIVCNNCKAEVILLDPLTNTCSCGTDYNGFGQELAPRSQWGWDTGETVADIINYRDDDFY